MGGGKVRWGSEGYDTMSSGDENPIPRLDTCCGCIQLKMGVLILCVLQMIASAFMILLIGSYILFGSA